MSNLKPDLVGASLQGMDLRGKDLTRHVLFRTNLRGAKLFGVDITVNCATFDGVQLDSDQVAMLLGMIALADISDGWKTGLHALIKAQLGLTRYNAVKRYLALAE